MNHGQTNDPLFMSIILKLFFTDCIIFRFLVSTYIYSVNMVAKPFNNLTTLKKEYGCPDFIPVIRIILHGSETDKSSIE